MRVLLLLLLLLLHLELLGDIAIHVTVPWSVCLSASACLSVTLMHCAQTAEDIDKDFFNIRQLLSLRYTLLPYRIV